MEGLVMRVVLPVPYKTRIAVLERAKGRCEDCGGVHLLELHHVHYRTAGEEEPDDLRALCRDCHYHKHMLLSGEFCADPEEVEHEREAYDHAWYSSE